MENFIERMTNFYDVRYVEEGVYFARTFHEKLPRVTLEVSQVGNKLRININEIGHTLEIEMEESK